MPQIKKPDDLQSIANLIRFFRVRDNFLVMAEIPRNNRFLFHVPKRSKDVSRQSVRIWRLIYRSFSLAKSLPFTDTSMKMGLLSVNGLL